MRPYRPPRFSDEEIVPTVVDRLEAELDIEILLRTTTASGEWEIRIQDECAGTVDRWRDGDGYSVFDISADAFESIVREAVEQ